MTKPKIDCMMKRLGKLIWAEHPNNGPDYELPERFAPALMDLEYIELRRFPMPMGSFHFDCSSFFSTQKGRDAYFEWIKKVHLHALNKKDLKK